MTEDTKLAILVTAAYVAMGLFFNLIIHNRAKGQVSFAIHNGLMTLASAVWFTPTITDGNVFPAWLAWVSQDRVPPFWSFFVFGCLLGLFWKSWGWLLCRSDNPPADADESP